MVLEKTDPGTHARGGKEGSEGAVSSPEITFYLGIDPGISGGAAVVNSLAQVSDFITFKATETDINRWFERFDGKIREAVIEKVHSFPKQGVKSMFTFGQSYGFLRGLLVAHKIRFHAVAPGVWQRKLGCLTKGSKKVTYRRAQELFPFVNVTHGIADALLIADYARMTAQRDAE